MPKATTKSRQELRARFARNALLTETDFAELIAATLNLADDGLLRLPDQSLGLVRQSSDGAVLRLYADPAAEMACWQMHLTGANNPALGLAGKDGKLALVVDGTTGHVGIGVTAPAARLSIAEATGTLASANRGTVVIDHENAGGGSSLVFRSKVNRGSDYAYIEYRDQSPAQSKDEAALLTIGIQNDSSDHLALMPSGNVGIGTITPEYKLQVSGTVGVSGVVDVATGTNLLRLSANSTALTDSAPINRAEIANDTDRYPCLMIIGTRSAGALKNKRRQVGLWDDVTVAGTVRAAGYVFAMQGFEFELKDGNLTPINKTKTTYSYTGSNQTFVVPAGVTWIFVKLWGAGGGAGKAGGWSFGADGGGGGHTRGLFPVTPGDTLLLVVGRGGTTVNGTAQSYGGGGANGGTGDDRYGGQGGGYCGIFINNSLSSATALAIAGGGGGGGSSRAWCGNVGGAGGGLVGQRGASPYDGKHGAAGAGGTQAAGGAGGSPFTRNGSNGGALQGGAGANPNYGGSGGGGYFGGGGGAYSEANTMGGGGGGSGFVAPSGTLTGTYVGNYRQAACAWDPDFPTSTTEIELPGFGGQNTQNNQANGAQSGGHAFAVVYY
ncbi:MAG: glycine-rich protein [Cyanobacteriota bacterium]